MSARTAYAAGTPAWVDLMTTSRDQATTFYGELFGWDFEIGTPETGGYAMAMLGGRPVAGIGEAPAAGQGPSFPPAWTTYLAVDDLDATVKSIADAGGSTLMGPMDVMGQGRVAVAADPAGAVFGLWQAGGHPGAGVVNEPNTVTWNECASRDADAAWHFYRTVFGYDRDTMDAEGFDYSILKIGGKPVAGLMPMPERMPAEVPSHWLSYFAVADTDAAVAKVRELGGTVRMGPLDSSAGRMAVVADPAGAVFAVIASTEQS